MRRGLFLVILMLSAAVFTNGCVFGPSKFKGVMGYRPGRVYIKHDKYYKVGILPEGWKRMKTGARTISFYNPNYRSSISTDAYCGNSMLDRSLSSLSGDIITAVENRKVVREENFTLDGRDAVRLLMRGGYQGVPVTVDLVIVRKDVCVFDMYATIAPGFEREVVKDFETFFNGFHY